MKSNDVQSDGVQLGYVHFRFAAQECVERLSVCGAIAELSKDLGDVEAGLSKSLSKVGKLSLEDKQSAAISPIVSGWDVAIKNITATTAKQHAQVSHIITQTVSKSLYDVARLHNKRVLDIVNKVKTQQQDIARARENHQKQLVKYKKTVQDVEASIKYRDAAVLEELKKNAVVAAKDKGEDESFVNRSLNKVMTKMKLAPSDFTRRATAGCQDLVAVLVSQESQLAVGCQRINSMRDDHFTAVMTAMKELHVLEKTRLRSMVEGLRALSQTQNVMVGQLKGASAAFISERAGAHADPQAEVAALLKSIEDSAMSASAVSVIPGISDNGQSENVYLNASRHAGWKKDTTARFHQVQRLMEVLDVLKVLVNWAGHALRDTVDANRAYAKAIRAVCERHGFPNRFSSTVLDTDDASTNDASTLRSAELMAGVEAPSVKAAWQFAVQAFEESAAVHQRVAATYADELIPPLVVCKNNIASLKKELDESQTSCMKDIDTAQKSLENLSQRHTKICHELKEQRAKLREAQVDSSKAAESDGSDDSDSDVAGTTPTAASAAAAAASAVGADGMRRLDKIKKSVVDKLRLETPEDKRIRRQARVDRLEVEERKITESVSMSTSSLQRVLVSITTELDRCLTTAKEVLSKDMVSLLGVLGRLGAVQMHFADELVAPFRHFEDICNFFDPESDMESFESAVLTAAGSCKLSSLADPTGTAVVRLELPETVHFVPIRSPTIDEERRQYGSASSSPLTGGTVPTSDQIFPSSSGGSSNGGGSCNSSGISTMASGREKASSAVKKLFAVSAFTPVGSMKPESLIKKLTSRSGSSSPLTGIAPQVARQEGSLTQQGAEALPDRDEEAPQGEEGEAVAAGDDEAFIKEALRGVFAEAGEAIAEGAAEGRARVDGAVDATRSDEEEDKEVAGTTAPPFDGMTPPQQGTLSPSSTDLPTASRVRRKRIAPHVGGAEDASVAKAPFSPSSTPTPAAPASATSPGALVVVKTASIPAPVGANAAASTTATATATVTAVTTAPTTVTAVLVNSTSPPRKTSTTAIAGPVKDATTEALKADDLAELTRFGLGPGPRDRILESFSCALYPKKGLLSHGRMFVTPQYVAFSGWPDCRVLLSLKDISKVEKTNTLIYIPNAILVHSKTFGEFFFGSFIDRDVCYSLLTGMAQVVKRLGEIDEGGEPETRDLAFGLQMPKGGMGSLVEELAEYANLAVDQEKREAFLHTLSSTYQQAGGGVAGAIAAAKAAPAAAAGSGAAMIDDDAVSRDAAVDASTDVTTRQDDFSVGGGEDENRRRLVRIKAALDAETDLEDGVDLEKLIGGSGSGDGIEGICTHVFPSLALDVWRTCWLNASGYGHFLRDEGDLEITTSEWVKRSPRKTVDEDTAKLPFTYERSFSYSHPRTTMLMFGPKNAPAKQTQYLYLPVKDAPVGLASAKKKPRMLLQKALTLDVASDFGTDSDSDEGSVSDMESTSAVWRDSIPSGCMSDESVDLAAAQDPLSVLRRQCPRRGCVMTVTQFDGIPMADCFKVIQYWAFERGGPGGRSTSAASTTVRVGVAVHFVKKTILKAQVFSGVRDELRELSKRWCVYFESRVAPANVLGPLLEEGEEEVAAGVAAVKGVVGVGAPVVREAASRGEAEAGRGKPLGIMARLLRTFTTTRMLVVAVGVLSTMVYVQYSSQRALTARVVDLEGRIEGLQAALTAQNKAQQELALLVRNTDKLR